MDDGTASPTAGTPAAMELVVGERAATMLGAFGFALEPAGALARNDCVFLCGARVVVAASIEDALTNEERAFVAWADPRLTREPAGLTQLRKAVSRTWPLARQLTLRLPPSEQPPDGFRLIARYVRKSGVTAIAPPSADVDVQPARASDLMFIQSLLVDSLHAGAKAQGDAVPVGVVRAVVERDFRDFGVADGPNALVARMAGERVGAAIWLPDEVDEVTGVVDYELVDVNTTAITSRGLVIEALTAKLEQVAAAAGRSLLGNVTHESNGRDERVFTGLAKRGWVPAHTLWRVRLDTGR